MPVGSTGFSVGQVKEQDFNFAAPLDMTNISVNYDTKWLMDYWRTGDVGDVFRTNVRQALKTAEPGFSFNFFEQEDETLRNACTEVTSADDSDVCNLGSINLGRIENLEEFSKIVELATKFLICGTLKAKLPYERVYKTREKNRRLGLGLMGMHEWLIKKGYKYEVTEELHKWMAVYKGVSDETSRKSADSFGISRPVANRAIAPTGSIGILAGTSTGVEPIFAVAYKRRYLKGQNRWHYQYVVDSAAQEIIDLYGIDPDKIESALDLAKDYERRMKFQADVQDYVDMSISSTINIPEWGSKLNNEDTVDDFADTLASYAHRLRGFTVYPDGCRGGQPLSSVPYKEAVDKLGEEFEEGVETHDICDITGHGGSCGV
jgi:ribonucleoside-diphosphate reductase alpha chain